MHLVEAKVCCEKGCFFQILDEPSTLHMSQSVVTLVVSAARDISTARKLGLVSGPVLEGLCGWLTHFWTGSLHFHSVLHSANSVARCPHRWFLSFDLCWLNTDTACSSLGRFVTSQTAHRELREQANSSWRLAGRHPLACHSHYSSLDRLHLSLDKPTLSTRSVGGTCQILGDFPSPPSSISSSFSERRDVLRVCDSKPGGVPLSWVTFVILSLGMEDVLLSSAWPPGKGTPRNIPLLAQGWQTPPGKSWRVCEILNAFHLLYTLKSQIGELSCIRYLFLHDVTLALYRGL